MSPDPQPASLFDPEGRPLTDPSQVEHALASLWKPPPAQHEAAVASRICKGNLVVVGLSAAWPRLSDVLGELSPLVPSRTVVLLLEEADPSGSEGVRGYRASVSALCHVPQPGRPQVCCEQIVLRSAVVEPEDLVRTFLPLLESDVPTQSWWTVDPAEWPVLFAAVGSLSDRLIVDAGAAGLTHLESVGRCAVRELGWYRTARWREQIVGLFDGPAAAALSGIQDVVIEMAGEGDEHRVDAFWLAAFLAGQLGWQGDRREPGLCVFQSAGRSIPVTLGWKSRLPGGLVSLVIRCDDAHFEIVRCTEMASQYRIIECDAEVCELPRCIEAVRLGRAEALAMGLAGRVADLAFTRAAPVAAWMAGDAA